MPVKVFKHGDVLTADDANNMVQKGGTDWADIAISSGWATVNPPPQWCRIGNVVYISGAVQRTAGAIGSSRETACTLPTAARPAASTSVVQVGGSGSGTAQVLAATDGTISIRGITPDVGSVLYISMSYVAAHGL